jgi:hypothetical protein
VRLSHFEALFIFSVIVSTVFALTTKSEPREQFRYGIFVFLSFLAVAVVVGWIMYPFPFCEGHRPTIDQPPIPSAAM